MLNKAKNRKKLKRQYVFLWIEYFSIYGFQIEAIEKSSIHKKTYWRFNLLRFVASFCSLIAQINKLMFYENMPKRLAYSCKTLICLFAQVWIR